MKRRKRRRWGTFHPLATWADKITNQSSASFPVSPSNQTWEQIGAWLMADGVDRLVAGVDFLKREEENRRVCVCGQCWFPVLLKGSRLMMMMSSGRLRSWGVSGWAGAGARCRPSAGAAGWGGAGRCGTAVGCVGWRYPPAAAGGQPGRRAPRRSRRSGGWSAAGRLQPPACRGRRHRQKQKAVRCCKIKRMMASCCCSSAALMTRLFCYSQPCFFVNFCFMLFGGLKFKSSTYCYRSMKSLFCDRSTSLRLEMIWYSSISSVLRLVLKRDKLIDINLHLFSNTNVCGF